MTAKDYYRVRNLLIAWGHDDATANQMIMQLITEEAEEEDE